MKLVVDTNILFSYFKKDSFIRKLLVTTTVELLSPEISIEELMKYSNLIISKCNIDKREFRKELENLKNVVKIVKKSEYGDFIDKAIKISPDKDDAHFFALCIIYSCALWSNDSKLKNQEGINVLNTEEIIDLLM